MRGKREKPKTGAKPISFHPLGPNQVIDDLLKIPPMPRATKLKRTAKHKRGKKVKR